MDAEKSLTFRLESYLVQLADINRRWSQWLATLESATVSGDPQRLQDLEPSAVALFDELKQVVEDRHQLLVDAQASGLPHTDLSALARYLPAWRKAAFRASLIQARSQLANLRRLHVATWVFISQAVNFYADSMQLLMAGTQPYVYLQSGNKDTTGGRLLDASL